MIQKSLRRVFESMLAIWHSWPIKSPLCDNQPMTGSKHMITCKFFSVKVFFNKKCLKLSFEYSFFAPELYYFIAGHSVRDTVRFWNTKLSMRITSWLHNEHSKNSFIQCADIQNANKTGLAFKNRKFLEWWAHVVKLWMQHTKANDFIAD